MAKPLPQFQSTFATYQAVATIGEGGAGRVFAVTGDDGQAYAVKVLHAEYASREKARRFKNEILFGTRTSHPNIVPIVDHGLSGDTDARPFYVMRRYEGTLRDLIKKTVPVPDGLNIFAALLDGVEAAHLLGVVHRDVKPENVLMDQGVPLVADFGIARFSSEQMATAVETSPRTRLANFIYAAPEQRQQGRSVDHRADIFALGLILNELFTGDVPHGAGYVTIGQKAPSFPYLDELVAQMIAQRPEDRPNSIAEVKKQLIARHADFVSLQKIDALKRTVVPASTIDDPVAQKPIELVSGNWDGQNLIFQLSYAPPPGWLQYLTSRSAGSFYMNYPPERIHLAGATAYWPSSASTAQEQINQFKRLIEYANREHVRAVQAAAQKRERDARATLQAETRQEEERRSLASTLKF